MKCVYQNLLFLVWWLIDLIFDLVIAFGYFANIVPLGGKTLHVPVQYSTCAYIKDKVVGEKPTDLSSNGCHRSISIRHMQFHKDMRTFLCIVCTVYVYDRYVGTSLLMTWLNAWMSTYRPIQPLYSLNYQFWYLKNQCVHTDGNS